MKLFNRQPTNPFAEEEKRVVVVEKALEFLYGELIDEDRTTARAMVMYGADDEQIMEAILASALNRHVAREDKSRYAFGCRRNICAGIGR